VAKEGQKTGGRITGEERDRGGGRYGRRKEGENGGEERGQGWEEKGKGGESRPHGYF